MKDANMKTTTKLTLAQRKTLFEAVMNNLNDACKVNDEVITKVGSIPRSLMEVDMRYQGDRRHNKTDKLAQSWDWRKYDNVTVVPHRESYTFSLVDGQNRFNASGLAGIDTLPAKVLWGVTDEEEERLKAEALLFAHQDDQEDKLSMPEKHKALVIAEDKAAVAIDQILKANKISHIAARGVGRGNKVSQVYYRDYTSTYRDVKSYGKEIMEFTLNIVKSAGWENEANAYTSKILRPLRNLWKAYDTEAERTIIEDSLGKELRLLTPEILSSCAKARYTNRSTQMAVLLWLQDWLVQKGAVQQNITITDKTVTTVRSSERMSA